MKKETRHPVAIFWFRRDLRLHDNTGLHHALKSGLPVQCVFVFDRNILDKLENKNDRRVSFIHYHLQKINLELRKYGSRLITLYDTPENAWQSLFSLYQIKTVYANHDYEPYALKRDAAIEKAITAKGASFYTFKDQVIFEKGEVAKDDGNPYTVFTPYWRKYLQLLDVSKYAVQSTEKYFRNFVKDEWEEIIPLEKTGFKKSDGEINPVMPSAALLKNYGERREFPSKGGTSRMSVHLRFGTVSIRELVKLAVTQSERYMNELIWREFYMMILWHFPHVVH